jgi:tetratricopeptide (TPR) repeat protein
MPGIPYSYSFPDPSEKEPPRLPNFQKLGILALCLLFLGVFSCLYFFLKNPTINLDQSLVSVKNIHPDFIGRENYLNALQKALLSNSKNRLPTALLWGEGGVGKSEIAITFANTYQKQFSFIYWIDSATEGKYSDGYRRLATLLNISFDEQDPIEKLRQKVHSRLEAEKRSKPWLLIFDNIESSLNLPQRGNGAVLMTSRNQFIAEGHCCLEVCSFNEKEAHALVAKITQKNATDNWQQLIQELDYFPLILNLATHYITTTPNMTVEKYLSLLNTNHTAVLENSSINARYPSHLLASWKMSADALKKQDLEAFEWLHFCSYLHPDAIPVEWISKWLKFKEFKENIEWKAQEILRTITHQSFMRYNEKTHTLSLHRLKQEALRKNESPHTDAGKQTLSFLANQTKSFDYCDDLEWHPESWEDWKKWEPHASWFISCFKEQFPSLEFAKLYKGLGNFLTVIAHSYDKALLYYTEGLKLQYECIKNKTHPDVAWSLCNLGWCWTLKGEYEKGLVYIEQADNICNEFYGDVPNRLSLTTKVAQGRIKNWQFETKKSLNLFESALKIQEQLYGSIPHPSLSECLKWIGYCWLDLGNYTKAIYYEEKALKTNVQIYEDQFTPQRGYILNGLGRTLRHMGDLPKAAQCIEESLKKFESIYIGQNHYQIARCFEDLGNIYLDAGNYKKALLFHEKALKVCYGLFPDANKTNPYFATLFLRIGADWERLGKNKKASSYYTEALKILINVFKDKTEEYFIPFASRKLEGIWSLLGNLKGGIQFLEEAIKAIKKMTQNNPHPKTLEVLEALAIAYLKINPQKAEEYSVEAKRMEAQLQADFASFSPSNEKAI